MRTSCAMLGATFLLLLHSTPVHGQASRTWVSGVGDDALPCSRTAPCKTFAGAIGKTADNGIINCLDAGAYGAVTITKSITIDCTNTMAGVLASPGGNGINVSGAGIEVTLRGLAIEGRSGGFSWINFTQGASLLVEKCKIFGFQADTRAQGIRFVSSTSAQLFVSDTTISHNGNATIADSGGIFVDPGSASALVTLDRVRLVKNFEGFRATGKGGGVIFTNIQDSIASLNGTNGFVGYSPAGGASVLLAIQRSSSSLNGGSGIRADGATVQIFIGSSMVTANGTGFDQSNGGVIRSYVDSAVDSNTSPGGATPPAVPPL